MQSPAQSRLRRPSLTLFLLLAVAATAHAEKPRKPTPPLPAQQYPCHDAHPSERVTIAAEPGDTKNTAPNTRLDYWSHGFLPIRVIVTNDSDLALNLDDARIHFIAADDTVIPAATDDDLDRGMSTLKNATGTKVPLPMPLPPLTIHHKGVDKQVLADDNDFSFQTTTVPAHTTIAGYLFYDIRDLDDPALKGATLELRKVRFAASNKVLDTFEIPLHPTTAKP